MKMLTATTTETMLAASPLQPATVASSIVKQVMQINQSRQFEINVTINKCPLELGAEQPEQLYVNLSTFWYAFLALITTVGLLISLISNMIIIFLFTR